MTIKEYSQKHDITRQAVLYKIKKGYVKADKNSAGVWIIEDDEKEDYHDRNKGDEIEVKLLCREIEHLKNELQSKEEIIQAERRTNIALLSSLENHKSIEEIKPKKGFISRLFSR